MNHYSGWLIATADYGRLTMEVKASGGADGLSGLDLRCWHGCPGSRLTSKDGFLCVPLAV